MQKMYLPTTPVAILVCIYLPFDGVLSGVIDRNSWKKEGELPARENEDGDAPHNAVISMARKPVISKNLLSQIISRKMEVQKQLKSENPYVDFLKKHRIRRDVRSIHSLPWPAAHMVPNSTSSVYKRGVPIGTLKKDGIFTTWKPTYKQGLSFNDRSSKIVIKETGVYYIYSQVGYDIHTAKPISHCIYSETTAEKELVCSVTSPNHVQSTIDKHRNLTWRNYNTNFISGAFLLAKGSTVWVAMRHPGYFTDFALVGLDPALTNWGLFLASRLPDGTVENLVK